MKTHSVEGSRNALSVLPMNLNTAAFFHHSFELPSKVGRSVILLIITFSVKTLHIAGSVIGSLTIVVCTIGMVISIVFTVKLRKKMIVMKARKKEIDSRKVERLPKPNKKPNKKKSNSTQSTNTSTENIIKENQPAAKVKKTTAGLYKRPPVARLDMSWPMMNEEQKKRISNLSKAWLM